MSLHSSSEFASEDFSHNQLSTGANNNDSNSVLTGVDNSEETRESTVPLQIPSASKCDDESKTKRPYTLKMITLCNDLLLLFCVAAVTYAALTNESPKTSKSPTAYPFFSKNSPVTDWYRGHIRKTIEHSRTSDFVFLMLYAPWDAESQQARREFEIVAKHMQKFVTFSAVNCWHPSGQCKHAYNKIYEWPIFIVYPINGQGIRYNGPIIAEYMIRFLQNICWPLKRLPKSSIPEYQDSYITANVNALPGSNEYFVLYSSALKYLEKDPFQSLKFYVQVQPAGIPPSLMLHLWNETLVFPVHEKKWKVQVILQWLIQNVHQVTEWVAPTGSKSLQLFRSIKSSSFFLFTPFNPLQTSHDYYNMLQEIAQEYHNCEENSGKLPHLYSSKRKYDYMKYEQLKLSCRNKFPRKFYNTRISTSYPKNYTDCSKHKKDSEFYISSDKKQNYVLSQCDKIQDVPRYLDDEYELTGYYKTSMLKGSHDSKSLQNLATFFQKEDCRNLYYAATYYPALVEKPRQQKHDQFTSPITGAACKTNESLSFIAMDSLKYYHFAEKLGIDLAQYPDKSAAVIVNHKMESHFIMSQFVNTDNIRYFIGNYTTNNLSRSWKSIKSISSKNSHAYSFKDYHTVKTVGHSSMSIEELNSETFLNKINQNDKTLIIFYYSRQCSYCNGISYAFLTAAQRLNLATSIQFARIDGELNILPWEYTMEAFPTILLLPAKRKADSVVFPINLPITVPNLIGFLLTNLDLPSKLHAIWSICIQTESNQELEPCIHSLRMETLSVIEKTLQKWRTVTKRQKQLLLYKLVQLRQLHMLFVHSSKNQTVIQSSFAKLYLVPSPTSYYKHYEENYFL